jgi:hypothetical protein
MRIVDVQRGAMLGGEHLQGGERRHVAVHAEYRFGDEPTQTVALLAETRGGARHIGVGITAMMGPTRQYAIDERGVVQAVVHHEVAAFEQAAQCAEIGQVTRGEQQCRGHAGVVGQGALEFVVQAGPTREQRRAAAAETLSTELMTHAIEHTGMSGQS